MSEISMHLLSVPIREERQRCYTLPSIWCGGSHLSRRFGEGDTSLEDRPRSERFLQAHIEQIKLLTEDNPPEELSAMLGCNQSTIRLEKLIVTINGECIEVKMMFIDKVKEAASRHPR